MEQKDLPFDLYRRKGQMKGNLQQAPQFKHLPRLFLATGRTEVNVLFIFAIGVLLFLSTITLILALFQINEYNEK
jgi:hypothetical protein